MARDKIMHHGLCKGEIEARDIGTDYFTFFHKSCREKGEWKGHFNITAILIDNHGRVIFNLKCRTCGFTDAIKTHPFLWIPDSPKDEEALKLFHLSPKLKNRIKKHEWDDL